MLMISLLKKNPHKKIQKVKNMCREHTLSVKAGNKILLGYTMIKRKTACFVVIVANLTKPAKNVFREDGCTSVRKEVV